MVALVRSHIQQPSTTPSLSVSLDSYLPVVRALVPANIAVTRNSSSICTVSSLVPANIAVTRNASSISTVPSLVPANVATTRNTSSINTVPSLVTANIAVTPNASFTSPLVAPYAISRLISRDNIVPGPQIIPGPNIFHGPEIIPGPEILEPVSKDSVKGSDVKEEASIASCETVLGI